MTTTFTDNECDILGNNNVTEMEYSVIVQNRFSDNGGGDGFQRVERQKRKKMSSGGSFVTNSGFNNLTTDEKLNCLFEKISVSHDMLKEVQREQNKQSNDIHLMNGHINETRQHVQEIENVLKLHSKRLTLLSYKSIDIEARSRRNNLIFWGLAESGRENCADNIMCFIERELGTNTHDMCIDRAHRLGRPSSQGQGDRRRPIIVRFRDYVDTDTILRQAYRLKGTRFGVDRDYPKEIAQFRKRLYSSVVAREARANRSKVQVRYPARLVIDGHVENDAFPNWFNILNTDRIDIETPRVNAYSMDTDSRHSVYSQKTDKVPSDQHSSEDDQPVFNSPKPTHSKHAIPENNNPSCDQTNGSRGTSPPQRSQSATKKDDKRRNLATARENSTNGKRPLNARVDGSVDSASDSETERREARVLSTQL